MTRLSEALILAAGLFALWIRLLTMKDVELYLSRLHVQLLPIYGIGAFGIISAIIVLHRTFTFNSCPEAYEELKQEIDQAKQDLIKKGLQFKNHDQ